VLENYKGSMRSKRNMSISLNFSRHEKLKRPPNKHINNNKIQVGLNQKRNIKIKSRRNLGMMGRMIRTFQKWTLKMTTIDMLRMRSLVKVTTRVLFRHMTLIIKVKGHTKAKKIKRIKKPINLGVNIIPSTVKVKTGVETLTIK